MDNVDGSDKHDDSVCRRGRKQQRTDKVNMLNVRTGKDGHSLKCIYTNIDGLNAAKGVELNICVQKEKPDVICLTETKLTENCLLSQYVDCADFQIFRKDRSSGNGGGVLIMVRNSLVATQQLSEIWEEVEVVVCQLNFGKHFVNVAVMYRPPGSPAQYNTQVRKALRAVSANQNAQVLVCGDFNYREINWRTQDVTGGENSEQARFLDECTNLYICQHVLDFTRVRGMDQPSVLDLVLTREELEITNLEYCAPIGSSDHCMLTFWFDIEGSDGSGVGDQQQRRNFHKGDYAEATTMFETINWEEQLSTKGVDEAWALFLDQYQDVVNKTVPLYQQSGSRRKKKWVTGDVLHHTQKKEEAWKRLRKNKGSRGLRRIYNLARNSATNAVRKAKSEFEHKLACDIKTNPRAFYAYARSKTTIREEVQMVMKPDGQLTETLLETCEEMNAQFQKVFNKTDGITPPTTGCSSRSKLLNCDIEATKVENLLRQLKTPSAPGPDGVHSIVLRSCAKSLAKPLSIIFKKSLDAGRLPSDWTRANVSPIFKKGTRTQPLNYRPVSLTSVPCKILEKLVKEVIVEHLKDNQILSQQQHGFRAKMSCLTQLLEYTFDLENALDKGDCVDAIYLDCQKAFDSVPHGHLLCKLRGVGIEGQVLEWIRGFLRNREQRVSIRGCHSGWRSVWSGVPQGSVLGPVLFLVYINDLLDGLQSSGKLFADDAKIYRSIRSQSDQVILQEDLDKLHEWSEKWLLNFNESKCKVMHFGAKNPNYDYRMGNTTLATSTMEKDLGILITPNLKPSDQVSRAASAANSMLGRIRRTFTCLDEEMFVPLYKTLVRPRIEYAVQAWNPYLQKDVTKLKKVQRRATKLIPALADLPYEDRLKRLELTTLQERRVRGDLIEVFKILKGFDAVNAGVKFLELDTGPLRDRTRGHSMKLTKPRHRTHKRTKFFSSRVVELWNSLPERVITSASINTFKRRYDRHIAERS